MAVVRDPGQSADERARAITGLAMLGTQLKGRACLQEIARRYDAASPSEKGSILTCFITSGDPRGIPLFMHVLGVETNLKRRVWAASGLAAWNVRRGIDELVKLLNSKERMPQPGHLFYVRDNVLRIFRLNNIHKGWGFPDDKQSAEWPPDVMPPPEVAARLRPSPTIEEIRKWWAANQDRFPDWKPGDPLPEAPE